MLFLRKITLRDLISCKLKQGFRLRRSRVEDKT